MKPLINSTTKKYLYAYLAISILIFSAAKAQSWRALGPDDNNVGSYNGVEYLSLALDAGGTPYIVFKDPMVNGKATVRKYNGILWTDVGSAGFSAGSVAYTSIAIDGNGVPYVVYQDAGNSGKATVKKYDGNSWVDVGIAGFSAGTAAYTRIAVDGTGIPYVVYEDDGNGNKVTVQKFYSGAWINVGTAGFSAGTAAYTSISIDGSGIPYVVYQDGGNSNKATVKKFDGAWVNVGTTGISAGTAAYTSIAIDGSGIPYIIYQDGAALNKATVQKFDGDKWLTVGAAGFSVLSVTYTTIVIGSGIPYVLYSDGSNYGATVQKFDGASWVQAGAASSWEGSVKNTTIAISANGTLYMAYNIDGYASYNIASRAMVKKFDGSNWINIISADFFNGRLVSTTISNNGTPYVVINEKISGVSVVKKFNSITWTAIGGVGRLNAPTSIAVDPEGTPYVAFPNLDVSISRAIVQKLTNNGWQFVGTPLFSASAANFLCIAISNAGVPYVAYQDAGYSLKSTVKKFDGISWVDVGMPGFSAGEAWFVSIAIAPSGTPYVAYQDWANSKKLTVKKFNGDTWVDVGTAGFSSEIVYNNSFAIDAGGTPYITYHDGGIGNKAIVQKFDGTNWVNVGLPGFSSGSAGNPSIAINRKGIPYVSYIDSTSNNKATVDKFDGNGWLHVGTPGLSAAAVTSTRILMGANDIPVIVYGDIEYFAKSFGEFALPVHFLEFKGRMLNDNIELTWKTENEENTMQFIVERSLDGHSYSNVGTVAAINSSTIHQYNFTDRNVSSLGASLIYYRLKQNVVSGLGIYSPVVTIPVNRQTNTVIVYPNPVTNEVNAMIEVDHEQRLQARLIDCSGRIILSQQLKVSAGSTTLSFDMNKVAKGIYYLDFCSSSFKKQVSVIKQ